MLRFCLFYDLSDLDMARQARLVSGTNQQRRVGTGMGSMADSAVSGGHRAVYLFSGSQPVMAGQTQPAPGLQQQGRVGALMRIVAIDTGIGNRGMHK